MSLDDNTGVRRDGDVVVDQEPFTALTGERLRESMYINISGQSFIPHRALSRILDLRTIVEILAQYHLGSVTDKRIAQAAETIRKGSDGEKALLKIFAILIMSNIPNEILNFIDRQMDDSFLPMPSASPSSKPPTGGDDEKRILAWSSATAHWTLYQCDSFFRTQWSVMVPVFTRHGGVRHYKLSAHHILPFLPVAFPKSSLEPQAARELEGDFHPNAHYGYGEVTQISIHPDHYDFGALEIRSSRDTFAWKQLFDTNARTFRREADALKTFQNTTAVLPLLATLEVRTYESQETLARYSLLFPWAADTLDHLWKANHGSAKLALWFAKQSCRLATGLTYLHGGRSHTTGRSLFAVHGDIKPQNILWFSERFPDGRDLGELCFSEFGISRPCPAEINEEETNAQDEILGMSYTYRPPECDTERSRVSRSTDLRMLGCVFLEGITWILGDYDAVEEFADRRLATDPRLMIEADSFITTTTEGDGQSATQVKEQVLEWIQHLHQLPQCSAFCHDFLDTIQNHMLAVDPGTRLSAADLSLRLHDMHVRCQENEDYYMEGTRMQSLVALPTSSRTASPDHTDTYGQKGQRMHHFRARVYRALGRLGP